MSDDGAESTVEADYPLERAVVLSGMLSTLLLGAVNELGFTQLLRVDVILSVWVLGVLLIWFTGGDADE